LGSRLPPGLSARFFLQHSGEKGVHQPCGGGKLRVRGTGRLRVLPAATCLVPQLGWPQRRLRCCLLLFGWGVASHPPHGRRSRHAQVRHIHGFSHAGGRTGGRYKTSYAARAASAFLDGLVLTPAVRMGARTSLRTLGRPPFAGTALVRRWPLSSVLRWSPPLVRLPVAEVVASTGETISATCHRAFRLFSFNGLVVAPIGRWG
jgi:hypothetical protein